MTVFADLLPLAESIATQLKDKRQSVAVAESSTAGLISAVLLAVPGASAYYLGGGVIYTAVARRELLGITDEVMKAQLPLSESYVSLCASAIRKNLATTWGIGELGAAGPTGTRYGNPPGFSVIAIDGPVALQQRLETGSNDRVENMFVFARTALGLLQEAINRSSA